MSNPVRETGSSQSRIVTPNAQVNHVHTVHSYLTNSETDELLEVKQMSEFQILNLKTPLSPISLRHEAQYRWRGVPFLPGGSEDYTLDELEDDGKDSDNDTLSAQRSKTDTELFVPVLETPLKPVNLGRGSATSGGRTHIVQVEADDFEQGEAEQNNQEVDSNTNETKQNAGHAHQSLEWYTDAEISAFISYTHECLTSIPPRPLVTFYTPSTLVSLHPSPACLMLRKASRAGLAQLVRSSDRIEVYSVGAPPPVRPVGIGEHWWLGLTPAQVRAGPLAGKGAVRNAERSLQKVRQKSNRRLNDERKTTAEGVRRQ